jgi:predicted MFS family arabinose efflux permease
MGFVQMAFTASQVLGLPMGLYFANLWGWHSPFIMIVVVSIVVMAAIAIYFKPVDAHLKTKSDKNAFVHLVHTASNSEYLKTFAATILLATGGFMMMPFGTVFGVNNLKLSQDSLPMLYTITGIFTMFLGPMLGKVSDSWGKYRTFFAGSLLTIVIVIVYCNLGVTPFWVVVAFNVVMFAGITARMVSSQALVSAVPALTDRGAFMSINSSVQQIAGGIASYIAGMIVVQSTTGELLHYDILGYVVAVTTVITMLLIWFVNQRVMNKIAAPAVPLQE